MQRGEIYLASFPYGDVAAMKLRPVLLRLHKLATIHITSMQRYVGKISTAIQQEVDAKLRGMFSL
ncbi:hypothetical protein HYR99_19100 [Candidatus Poribacteria bacterium]|nr:hypothetical protein [Candidatus Poribacteria bacterium]